MRASLYVCVCRGLSPAESELRYLLNANKLALYGVDLHVAKVSLLSTFFFFELWSVFITSVDSRHWLFSNEWF